MAGGAVGTAAREALALSFPSPEGIPVIIGVINLVGAFLLGWLLDGLTRRGPDHGRRRAWRLLLGTGALGGFTTYSTLATDSAALIGAGLTGSGQLLAALGYAIGSVVLGVAAAGLGVVCAGVRHR